MAQKKDIMLPFSPFPPRLLKALSQKFLGIGNIVSKAFPYLKIELPQAGINYSAQEYGAAMAMLFLFYFAIGAGIFWVIAIRFQAQNAPLIGITIGGILALLVLVQLSVFPKIRISKRVRDIEKNLVFALRTMLIEIRSGVNLFDALNLVANSDYGELSKEMKKAVEEINTGENEEDALQKIAMHNPSQFLRRALWQIVGGMKMGTDVNIVLGEIVQTMNRQQIIQIKRYGSDLRMLSLIYMMIGVIIPALGLTFLVVLSSFPQLKISETMFWGLLAGMIILEFMYLGIMKSKRPTLIGIN